MTDEEKEAINIIKYNDIARPLACGDITICNISDLEIVLNLIQKQQAEIDEMAKFIEERINECPYDFWIEAEKELNCKECEEDYAKCWKQYFEKQVESEDKQC